MNELSLVITALGRHLPAYAAIGISTVMGVVLAIGCLASFSGRRKQTGQVQQPKNHRNHARTTNPSSVQSFFQSPVGQMIDCWVADWSPGGLLVFLSSCGGGLKLRQELAIKSSRDFTGPWVSVEVRYLRRDIYGWYIGCRFTKPVPLHVLHTFKSRDAADSVPAPLPKNEARRKQTLPQRNQSSAAANAKRQSFDARTAELAVMVARRKKQLAERKKTAGTRPIARPKVQAWPRIRRTA